MASRIEDVQSYARRIDLSDCGTLSGAVSPVLSTLGERFWCLAFLHDTVRLNHSCSTDCDGMLSVRLKSVKEARFFSGQAELKVWWYDGAWHGRLRVDGDGDDTHVFVEQMVLWGSRVEEGRKLVEPGKGSVIQMPFDVEDSELPIKVTVHSYFDHDEQGLIQFHDARLVAVVDKNGGAIDGP